MTRPTSESQPEPQGTPANHPSTSHPSDGARTDSSPHGAPHHDALPHDQRRARRPDTTVLLRRSRDDRVLGGVIGGIAGYVGADPRTLRLLVAALTALTGGVLGVVYLLLWLLLPTAP